MNKGIKRLRVLYLIKMLEHSSQSNVITQSTMIKTLSLIGIKCDRKTVAKDIDALIEYGYRIKKIKGGGCYLIEGANNGIL